MAFLSSCGIRSKNDIYREFPINSSLTIDILKKASQIIPCGEDLILVVDQSKDWDYYDPHLLFYDSLQKLISASYYSSLRIDSLSDNIIYGKLDQVKEKRSFRYRSDIPERYSVNLSNTNMRKRSGRMSNKIIERVTIHDNLDIVFHVKVSENKYAGLELMRTGKITKDNFEDFGEVIYNLSEIELKHSDKSISIINTDDQIGLESDIMLFETPSVFDSFYDSLWSVLTK